MPRTLNATLEAALDSGNFTFYSLLTVKEVGFAVIRTAQPVSFKLSGIEMDVKYSALDHDVYDGYSYPEKLSFMLTRGVTIAGVNYTIDSSYYFGVSSEWDGVFETIHASMLPNTKYSVAGDGTYKAVLDAICVANGKTAVYKNPAAAWLGYQFLPTGKTLDMNKASNLLNLIKQKYLIYACDNGSDQILFCSVASDSTALDHTLNIEKLKLNANLRNYRRFLSRDEAATIHYSGNAAAPLWNLGFLHSTAAHPAFSNSGGIEILPIAPHLKYLSFDNFQFNFAANYPDITYTSTSIVLAWVEEVFDPKAKIAWHIKVSSLDWGKGAEGGALPGTIERVAAYTPLVSTGFDGNLSPAVNNLQAFVQAVDDLDIPVLAGVSGAIAAHAAVQSGVHGLAIAAGKTLTVSESVTIAAGAAGYTLTVPGTGTALVKATALTAGYIPFGVADNLVGGDAGLFWDNANKNLIVSGAANPAIKISEGASADYYTSLMDVDVNSFLLMKEVLTGAAYIYFSPKPGDGSSIATFRVFRQSNTMGRTSFDIYKGDNSASVNSSLAGNGNSYINALVGNVLIGTAMNGGSKLRIVGLPVSAAGLSAGDIWNNGGVLNIV